jgi:predicted nuclease with TOPRIM domain
MRKKTTNKRKVVKKQSEQTALSHAIGELMVNEIKYREHINKRLKRIINALETIQEATSQCFGEVDKERNKFRELLSFLGWGMGGLAIWSACLTIALLV